MLGYSKSKFGVRGLSDTSTAVLGQSGTGVGVRGVAGNNIGVLGQATTSVGVYGYSDTNFGVIGESAAGLAAEFRGDVFVTGTLTALSKSAVVALPDGTPRRLYWMEAPEALFEDVGRGAW